MKKRLFKITATLFALSLSAVLVSCGDTLEWNEDGLYTSDGIIYQIDTGAYVVGVEEGYTEVNIPTTFYDYQVNGIRSDAFADSSVTKVTFSTDEYGSFSIAGYSFRDSNIETIENLPANGTYGSDAFSGLASLKSITVSGSGDYSIVDGTLIETSDSKITLRLVPAGSEITTANYDSSTKTFTINYDNVDSWALAYNQYIENVYIPNTTSSISEDAFANVKLSTVELETDETEEYSLSNVTIESDAFVAHKDLRLIADIDDDDTNVAGWLSRSRDYIYNHNLLFHPSDCVRTDLHIHGYRENSYLSGSYEGYDMRDAGNGSYYVDIDSYGGMTITLSSTQASDLNTEYSE